MISSRIELFEWNDLVVREEPGSGASGVAVVTSRLRSYALNG